MGNLGRKESKEEERLVPRLGDGLIQYMWDTVERFLADRYVRHTPPRELFYKGLSRKLPNNHYLSELASLVVNDDDMVEIIEDWYDDTREIFLPEGCRVEDMREARRMIKVLMRMVHVDQRHFPGRLPLYMSNRLIAMNQLRKAVERYRDARVGSGRCTETRIEMSNALGVLFDSFDFKTTIRTYFSWIPRNRDIAIAFTFMLAGYILSTIT